AHPPVDDDAGHQANWLRKHHQVQAARRRGPVFCDRDWLSALAYAHSAADPSLLDRRARWALGCLERGDLVVGEVYVVFQLDPALSLDRRANRLTLGHPWSSLTGLTRLAAFYDDPATAVGSVCPELAARLRTATWHPFPAPSIEQAARFLRDLVGQR
ncbi:MAG: hypothetical protein M3308_00440, partial [Actinomycetota bacterium]|nr:hypothetical protein [Actinomycetota bacterium]